eukprot:6225999-Pyramimonas_sp.AAC.1
MGLHCARCTDPAARPAEPSSPPRLDSPQGSSQTAPWEPSRGALIRACPSTGGIFRNSRNIARGRVFVYS